MSVLLLRLAGPMQSWGTQSRFTHRDTGLEPSRSGVIGLLCAALGRPRTAPLDDLGLDRLKMAVRVDREGRMACDFHTAKNVRKADGSGVADTVISSRFYLADADFLVGLQGERFLLDSLDAALRQPIWPLCLGRKSFVPGTPIPLQNPHEAIVESELEVALKTYPWHRRHEWEEPPVELRFIAEVPFGTDEPRNDVPLSFEKRTFTVRHVSIGFIPLPPVAETAHVSEQTDTQPA